MVNEVLAVLASLVLLLGFWAGLLKWASAESLNQMGGAKA